LKRTNSSSTLLDRITLCDETTKNHEFVVFLKEMMESGKLKSVIDKTYTFKQIPEAHIFVETGRKRGCIVVTGGHD